MDRRLGCALSLNSWHRSAPPMDYQTLIFDRSDAVATITLNRPDEQNALNYQMSAELFDVAVRVSSDDAVRAVVVTGTGKMFCPGGDLKDMQDQGDKKPEHLIRMATNLHNAIIRFAHMDAPVIMALNGTAAGGGFSLALSGDYVLASEKAKLVSAYTASGLTPDGSSTYFLAKHVGLLRAKELLLTNRVLTAHEAREWGLVTRVVGPDDLASEAKKLAESFAKGPTKAFGGLKTLLLTAYDTAMEAQLEKESRGISDMMRTHDGAHGLQSFLEKTKPKFIGK